MNTKQSQRGFTLIETLVYLALFALIMGGAVVAAYNMFESSGRSHTRAMIQEEGDFITAKIDWSLSGIQSISTPPTPGAGVSCAISPTLSVSKWDTSVGTIIVDLVGGNMRLSRGGNPAQGLNNTNITVSNLSFSHCYTGVNDPESVSASFTLSARTPNGMMMTQDFFTSQHLRK